jgi:hypothetical protein
MKTKKSFQNLLQQIGNSLSELRIKKGYTSLKEFTEDYDLPLIQYWRMEKGKANLTLKSLARIVSIHSLSVREFFCELNKK